MRKEVVTALAEGRGLIPVIKPIKSNGLVVFTYSIGWLSYWSHLAQVTLRLWQRKKLLPEPVFKLPGNYRWYSSREILEYSKAIHDHYMLSRDVKLLKATLIGINRKLVRQYSELSAATKDRYDASYIALPNIEKHQQALLASKQLSRASAQEAFHTKVKRNINHKTVNEDTKVKKDNSNTIGFVSQNPPPPKPKNLLRL